MTNLDMKELCKDFLITVVILPPVCFIIFCTINYATYLMLGEIPLRSFIDHLVNSYVSIPFVFLGLKIFGRVVQ